MSILKKKQIDQPSSNSRFSQNCQYHTRQLKYYQQKCAYHPSQNIVQFCQSQQCLLPVCPTCLKLHTEQHKLNKTTAQFQSIMTVLQQIRKAYSELDGVVEQIRDMLINIQKNKKDTEKQIRSKIMEHRNRLVKQFQLSLIQMQNKIIEQLSQDGQLFIGSIKQIDEQLSSSSQFIGKDRQNLQSDDILKHIIIYYGKNNKQIYQNHLQEIKQRGQSLLKRNMTVTVDDNEIINIKTAIARYIKINIAETAIRKDI